MTTSDNHLRKNIKDSLYMHGILSILYYKTLDEWRVHKWGEFDELLFIQTELSHKFTRAGMTDEANSLTLLELPQNEQLIFDILTCGRLEKTLKEIGLIP